MDSRGETLGMEHVRMGVLGNEAETTAPRPAKAAADSMFAGKGSVSDDATYCYWTTCSTRVLDWLISREGRRARGWSDRIGQR